MRNNCFLFAFAFVFMILAGCRNKGVNVADDGVTVISVDLNESEKVSMSDIISRIEIVELEGGPDSYVVGPRWFKVSNGKYYMDSRQTEAVYAFDSDGTFLFSTAKRKGNGHNEYVALNGFHVDKDGCIGIFSYASGYIKYDPTLKAVNRDDSLRRIGLVAVSDDVLAGAVISNDSLTLEYYSTTLHKKIGTASMAYNKKNNDWQFVLYRLHTYMTNDRECLYRTSRISDFSVFRVNKDEKTITEAYRYDTGNGMLDESLLSSIKSQEDITRLLSQYTSLWDFHINNDMIIAVLGHRAYNRLNIDRSFYWSFYQPQTGKQRLINTEMNDGKELDRIDQLDDGIIYTIVESYQFKDVDKMVDTDLLDEHSKEILDRRNDDTNAYIIKYYLRDDIFY